MSTLEELLYAHLTGDQTLAGQLASYGGTPAVFELLAPPDTDPGWSGAQTPRLEFEVVRQEDPERRVSGQVAVTIIDRDESMVNVAAVESRVKILLDGATFRPDEGTVTLRWARTDLFDQAPDYRGVTALYDLIAWPAGLTYAPDPVQALRDWATARWPSLQVDPATWAPSDTNPALYWRLAAVDSIQTESWGAWLTARFHGHVLALSPSVRLEWVRRVVEGIALDRRISHADASPLYFQSVAANSESDHLRVGQIRLTARCGVLQPPVADPILNNVTVSGDASGTVTQ